MTPKQPKKKKIRPKHYRFLQRYIETGNIGQSYLDAGFACKNKDVACACGSKLLRKLDSRLDLKEVFAEVGLTSLEVARKGKELLNCGDSQTEARTFAVLTKCMGWQREIVPEELLADILLVVRQYPKGERDAKGQAQEEKEEGDVLRIDA